MRKITINASNALWGMGFFKASNTEVINDDGIMKMFLHGHRIATLRNNKLSISSCGWRTTTTKERLNGVLEKLGCGVFQKNFEWFLSSSNGDVVPFHDGMIVEVV